MARAALLLVALLAAGALAGCTDDEPPAPAPATTGTPAPRQDLPLRFSGVVVDAATNETLGGATVRLDLAFVRPCQRPGVGYQSWELANDGAGRYGPFEVPRPRSDDVAFFLSVEAPGYAPNVTFVGPRRDVDIFHAVALHPRASIEGAAPPGTLVALQEPRFPRVALADAEGRFRFEDARAFEADLVAATDVPVVLRVAAPANLTIEAPAGRGWLLEGVVRGPSGAPLAADVVAWNGTRLHSVARSGDNGLFALPLPPEPAELVIEARTAGGEYGGTKRVELSGPPALREALVLRPLC